MVSSRKADSEDVFIYGANASDVPLELGGPVQIRDRLTSDAQGRGIVATPGTWAMAIAAEDGDQGQVRLVQVIVPQRVRSVAVAGAFRMDGGSERELFVF